jgi:hypothetical protein
VGALVIPRSSSAPISRPIPKSTNPGATVAIATFSKSRRLSRARAPMASAVRHPFGGSSSG